MKILRRLAFAFCIQAGVLLAATPTFSHHSTAMYDKANPRKIAGTVKALRWTNPHITLDFVADAKDDPEQRTWTVEASSPGVMGRSGWTKRSLNPGDKVIVEVAALRDGKPGGEMRSVTLANGEVLKWSFRAGEQVGIN